jgi:hypothetical protein
MFRNSAERQTKWNYRSDNTLQKKAPAWPTPWKCGEKTLHEHLATISLGHSV